MTEENKKELLSVLRTYIGTEENAPITLKDFLLLPDYRMLQDEQCFLILGGRGAGKTCLFNMYSSEAGFRFMMTDQSVYRSFSDADWKSLKGYDRNDPFPTADVLGTSLFSDEKAITAYWAGSLLFVLLEELKKDTNLSEELSGQIPERLSSLFSDIHLLSEPSRWVSLLKDNPEVWEKALRGMDQFLERKHLKLFVAYDSLDRLSNEYNKLFPFLRTLLSFWYTRMTRWNNIRCKIFLRTDLYDNSQMLQFPDASKIKNQSMILTWKPMALYQLLVKRMANCDGAAAQSMLSYLNKTPGLIIDEGKMAGYVPTKSREVMGNFIKNLIGEYMGATPKKGLSYQWIPNHLQDANGVLAPRSFLNCFREAANYMLENSEELTSLTEDHLLLPSSIQKALIKVSADRVDELTEEYVWLSKLKDALSGLTMLMQKEDFIRYISVDQWSEKEKATLPEQTAYGIFSVLEKLGIVFVTSDNRVNVPEIYLHGFHMKRRGGLKRPQDESND